MKAINWVSLNVRRLRRGALIISCVAAGAGTAQATQPPRLGEVETLKMQGKWDQRVSAARALGNDRVSEELAAHAADKIFRARLQTFGFTPSEIEGVAPAPPPGRRGMPTTGSPKMLTVLLSFPDELPPANPSVANITLNMYGAGSTEAQTSYFPLESLNRYYYRASQGLLDIGGTVLNWYRMPNPRDSYTPVDDQPNKARIFQMLTNALQYYDASQNFAQFDNNGDNVIDIVNIIWTGAPGAWSSFWWGYKWNFSGVSGVDTVRFDGKTLMDFTWQWLAKRGTTDGDYDPKVMIHETGHSLGLPDYYDYNGSVGPDGGVGGLDMMDANRGNHNAFSRWMLDWITPIVVGSGAPTLQGLLAGGDTTLNTNKAVVVFPNAATTPFGEFFLVENRHRVGNDSAAPLATPMPSDGLLIWHVDGTLAAGGNDFMYDNSYTSRKLLRLMEADGLEEIETGMSADAGDYYNAGDVFNPDSTPDSYAYDGTDTSVSVTNISANAVVMTALIGFEGVATVAKPVFTPPAGTYNTLVNVSIQCLTPGATVHYTTDGSTPTAASPIYGSPIALTTNTTIKAIGTLALYDDSPVSTASYSFVVATPTLSPRGGVFADPVTVTASCATPSAVIRYTTDGTPPTAASPIFPASLNLSTDTTVSARAFRGGFADSGIVTEKYRFITAPYLTDGVAKTGVAGPLGSMNYFRIDVPPNQVRLMFKTWGGVGDSDMYVRFGTPPELNAFDFRPLRSGTAESVTINLPAAGTWYVMLHAYKPYSGVSLLADYFPPTSRVATPVIKPAAGTYYAPVNVTMSCATGGATIRWTDDGTPPGPNSFLYTGTVVLSTNTTIRAAAFKPGMLNSLPATANYIITNPTITTLPDGVPQTGLTGAAGSKRYFKIAVPAGRSKLLIKTYGGSGDCDLYVRFGSSPTLSSWNYRPCKMGNLETVDINSPAAGEWHIMVYGFRSYANVGLLADY